MNSAARYVESLLPEQGRILPGVQLGHMYRPSLALGGDLFNVVAWNDSLMGLYLLDASGHGVSPALRSASLSTFLREDSLLRQVGSTDPGAILTEANTRFPLTTAPTLRLRLLRSISLPTLSPMPAPATAARFCSDTPEP